MGIFNIGGSKSKNKTTSKLNETSTQNSSTNTRQSSRTTTNNSTRTRNTTNTRGSTRGSSSTRQNTSSVARTEALTPEILQQLEFQIARQFQEQGAESEILDALLQGSLERANQGEDEIAKIIAAREREGRDAVQQQEQTFTRQAGSRLNTGVQELTNRAEIDLATSLAAIEGELNLENSDASLDALSKAVTAQQNQRSSEVAALAPLLQVLAAATQQTTTQGESLGSTQSQQTNQQTSDTRGSQFTRGTQQNTTVGSTDTITTGTRTAEQKTKNKKKKGSIGFGI